MNPANPGMVIRNETDADIGAISEVTIAAFETLEISNHTEQFIIEALRAAKALTVSLVAELDGRLIGHIAFSAVTISDLGRNTKLVWTRACLGVAGVSAEGRWQSPDTGRAVPPEEPECPGLLCRRTSGVLQEVRIPECLRLCD